MSDQQQEFKEFTDEWQKKHNVDDDDPLFAVVEIFEKHIASLMRPSKSEEVEVPSFTEFRDTLERLDQVSKRFSNVAQDLTKEMRKKGPGRNTKSGGGFVLGMIIGVMVAVAGYLAWEFYL